MTAGRYVRYGIWCWVPGLLRDPTRDTYDDLPWYQAQKVECAVSTPSDPRPERGTDVKVLWKGPRRTHKSEAQHDIKTHKAQNAPGDGVVGD